MYNHEPENYQCPFCLLIQGTENGDVFSVQGDIVLTNNTVTAFIGSHYWPSNNVNVLIAPNQHYENIFDLPDHFGEHLHRTARRIALALKRVYGCDGVSTRQHNESAGGQDVWHYHTHVTPRYYGDNLYQKLLTSRVLMPLTKRAEHAKRLREALGRIA